MGDADDAQLITELRARANALHSGEVSETARLCARAADALVRRLPRAVFTVTCDWDADADAYDMLGDDRENQIIAAISSELAKQITIAVSPDWLRANWNYGPNKDRVAWTLTVGLTGGVEP